MVAIPAELIGVEERAAAQQPTWCDEAAAELVRRQLAGAGALARPEHIRMLRSMTALAARGGASVIQCGDCAEDPLESTAGEVARKVALLDVLAGTMKMTTRLPVLRVARIAGQYAKPRTTAVEVIGDSTVSTYRGHMVNRPEPDAESRRPDPANVLDGFRAARAVSGHLGWHDPEPRTLIDPRVWISHDAMLMDYELPMVARDETGALYLTSAHWPWIGVRTGQPDGAHVALLARVSNPVACKVGTGTTQEGLLELCERLDPDRSPGRLTLISRMGADRVADLLPPLARAVRAAGHPVIWMCDPMHGNTVVTPDGHKTRYVDTVVREVGTFCDVVADVGVTAAGLHLETTPDAVSECVQDASQWSRVGDKYTSFCDPRLNPGQAAEVVSAWRD